MPCRFVEANSMHSVHPDLIVFGISHHRTPVALRERFALGVDQIRAELGRLKNSGACQEALIVSTCNRVEWYTVSQDAQSVLGVLEAHYGEFPEGIYRKDGHEVAGHLFRVVGGLDSMVLGEPEILGQVRACVSIAESEGTIGTLLRRLLDRAFVVAKRVRSETDIGRHCVGMGSAGVQLVTTTMGGLEGQRCLLLGAGKVGRQVARALKGMGLKELIVANRTLSKAVELAEQCGGTALSFDDVPGKLPDIDILLTALGAGEELVSTQAIRDVLVNKGVTTPDLLIVDLGVPRNVHPDVGALEGAHLLDIDDLEEITRHGRRSRIACIEQAEALVEEELNHFKNSALEMEGRRAIRHIMANADALCQSEITKWERGHSSLASVDRDAVEQLSQALVRKLLFHPIASIRSAVREGDRERLNGLVSLWMEE